MTVSTEDLISIVGELEITRRDHARTIARQASMIAERDATIEALQGRVADLEQQLAAGTAGSA